MNLSGDTVSVKKESNHLTVNFRDRFGKFSFRWLKDHSRDDQSFDHATRQRLTETASINADEKPSSVKVDESENNLVICWPEWHDSILPLEFLYRNSAVDESSKVEEQVYWDNNSFENGFPEADFNEIVNSRESEKDWLLKLYKFGFVLVSNLPVDLNSTQKLIKRIGYVRNTIYGGMWEFGEGLEYEDSAYTTKGIGPHTDGTYSLDPPGLQILHCLKFEGTGGQSILVDGFKVSEDLKIENPEAFELLSSFEVPGQYLGEDVHLEARHPIINQFDSGRLKQICYNNFDRASIALPLKEMEAFYEALKLFQNKISSQKYQIKFTLEKGMPLFFDNWRLLHARTSYTGKRRLCGGYVNREDFESRLRILGIKIDS